MGKISMRTSTLVPTQLNAKDVLLEPAREVIFREICLQSARTLVETTVLYNMFIWLWVSCQVDVL